MANKVVVSGDKITAIADAIRTKTGNSDLMSLDDMPTQIASIKGDGEDGVLAMVEKTVTEFSNEDVTKIGDYSFYDNRVLSVLNTPNVERVGVGAFTRCTGLNAIDMPKCKIIGSQSFTSCNGVKSFNMPLLEEVPQGALNSMTTLTEVNLSSLKVAGTQSFYFCSSLTNVDFLQLESIGQHAFNQTKMTTLIIRTNAVCTLEHTNAFLNSPIVRGTGYVYVPKELVDSYKSATNWSAYADQIRAIEDYPEITGDKQMVVKEFLE